MVMLYAKRRMYMIATRRDTATFHVNVTITLDRRRSGIESQCSFERGRRWCCLIVRDNDTPEKLLGENIGRASNRSGKKSRGKNAVLIGQT